MNWLWAYFRRKTFEAIQAGVHDAVAAGANPSGLSNEQAMLALLALARTLDPTATAATGALSPPTPPQLAGPTPSGSGEASDQVRRGPGRPRKHQEPPQ
jgi:hypothetical protein